jgi:transcriptional regulator with XRE-family HTH domain
MNWKTLIADLIARDFVQTKIAEECGVAQSTISGLASGITKSPSFDLGQKLLALHKRAMRSKRVAVKA